MNYILAFLFAGIVGLAGQALFLLTKKQMPPALLVLFGIGALLCGFGVMDWVNALCPGAMVGMLMNGGAMFANAGVMALNGDPSLFFVIWLIIIFMMLVGVLTGAVNLKLRGREAANTGKTTSADE